MNDGRQLRATHLILDYEPISRTFLDISNAIRANDYRLARIDVFRPGFLTPHDLPPVDHPVPQGIPLAAQSLQQVPLGQAIAEEGIASSSSLEEEIDKFQFEKEEMQGVEYCYIGGRGRNQRVLVYSNPCSYNQLRGGLFKQRS